MLNNDIGVGKTIKDTGCFEPEELTVIKSILKPGQTVIDCGANIGHHSVVFSKCVGPQGRVFAFEPQSWIFNLLAANIALNDCRNCTPYRLAVGDCRRKLKMGSMSYDVPCNVGARTISAAHPEWSPDGEEVDIVPLDEFCEEHHVRPDFIKIDVQTFEIFVLRGARRVLEACHPTMLVEISPFWAADINAYDYREIYRFLDALGYRLVDQSWRPIDRSPQVPDPDVEWNIIALPSG